MGLKELDIYLFKLPVLCCRVKQHCRWMGAEINILDMPTSLALNHSALSSEIGVRVFIWSYGFSNSASVCGLFMCLPVNLNLEPNEKLLFQPSSALSPRDCEQNSWRH